MGCRLPWHQSASLSPPFQIEQTKPAPYYRNVPKLRVYVFLFLLCPNTVKSGARFKMAYRGFSNWIPLIGRK